MSGHEIENTMLRLYDPRDVKIMGVINITPDSFSDGGVYFEAKRAVEHGLRLVEDGADYLDIGGESTRPGAEPVDDKEELRRIIPVIQSLAEKVNIPVSVDTYKSGVAKEAIKAGATIINDISAMTFDPEMADVVAASNCGVILMHMQGTPRNMQTNPRYKDVIKEIRAYLRERVGSAEKSGIDTEKIWVDPGIGFGKRQTEENRDNLDILANLSRFKGVGSKLVVGTSRKSFIGRALRGVPATARLFGSLGTFAWSALFGTDILRVHDVRETVEMLKLIGDIYTRVNDGSLS